MQQVQQMSSKPTLPETWYQDNGAILIAPFTGPLMIVSNWALSK